MLSSACFAIRDRQTRRGLWVRATRGRSPPNGSLTQPRRGPARQRQSGAPLAATNVKTAGSACKRRHAVHLGRKEGLQPRASERPAVGCSEKLGVTAHDMPRPRKNVDLLNFGTSLFRRVIKTLFRHRTLSNNNREVAAITRRRHGRRLEFTPRNVGQHGIYILFYRVSSAAKLNPMYKYDARC